LYQIAFPLKAQNDRKWFYFILKVGGATQVSIIHKQLWETISTRPLGLWARKTLTVW
jgi:hypothetical protein